MSKIGVKKGNFFDHLEEEQIEWLINEASDTKTDIGVVVASIIKDAHYEENNTEGEE
tara:strand:- start:431 stop:601 length:171 start_codon:yes stop_codon:yes gene_type:complete